MKNLIKIDLSKSFKSSDKYSIVESIAKGDKRKSDILLDYVKTFLIFAIDIETLEIVAGRTRDNKSFIYEDYYTKFDENELIDMSENFMYMEYSYVCTWNGNKMWGKYKNEFGGGHTINWEHYPIWGSRKARILDLLLDDE